MEFQSFLVTKNEHIKNLQLENCELCCIDINLWFKANNMSPSSMNEIRQFIFEEWLFKKILGIKNKVNTGCRLVIVFDSPNDSFIALLKSKISDVFESDICDVVLMS